MIKRIDLFIDFYFLLETADERFLIGNGHTSSFFLSKKNSILPKSLRRFYDIENKSHFMLRIKENTFVSYEELFRYD